jgi:hypothetical protein
VKEAFARRPSQKVCSHAKDKSFCFFFQKEVLAFLLLLPGGVAKLKNQDAMSSPQERILVSTLRAVTRLHSATSRV